MPSFLTSSQALVRFQDTTGFDPVGVFQGFKTGILELFIGNAFNIIYILRWYIIVAFVIGALITFSSRAFIFYKH